MSVIDPLAVLNAPLDVSDPRIKTVGDFLMESLLSLWKEDEGFSGKRPLGNSGWKWAIGAALVDAGIIHGKEDPFGDYDYDEGDASRAIFIAINHLASIK